MDSTFDQRFYVSIGDQVTFAKTISESDVYLFAGITGDFAQIHVNAEYVKHTVFEHRVVHGILVVGLMAAASTMLVDKFERREPDVQSYSVGYDRIRFIKPVFIGDTITVTYTIAEIDTTKQRSRSTIEARNQHGQIVAAAQHLIQWVRTAS
jgi:3-hydroxybutyryl-CoA dehydratase